MNKRPSSNSIIISILLLIVIMFFSSLSIAQAENETISNESIDSTAPNLIIEYPSNLDQLKLQSPISLLLNTTASDEYGISTYWYTLDNGLTNTTFNETIILLITQQANSLIEYNLIVYVNDTSNNINSSSIVFSIEEDSQIDEVQDNLTAAETNISDNETTNKNDNSLLIPSAIFIEKTRDPEKLTTREVIVLIATASIILLVIITSAIYVVRVKPGVHASGRRDDTVVISDEIYYDR